MIPFEGIPSGKIFKDPATVPLTFERCFPMLFKWAVTQKEFMGTSGSNPATGMNVDSYSSYDSPTSTDTSDTPHPLAPRKSMPPYESKSASFESPVPTKTSTKMPPAPGKRANRHKTRRVLLWGTAGGVDGYGGGM